MSDHPLRIVPPQPKLPDLAAKPMPAPEPLANDQAKLTELRRLLLLPEQQQLADIQQRLNDQRGRVKDLSGLLPEAVNARNAQDNALTASLVHNIGPALKLAIKQDPSAVIEAVTPVIGPAIRAAITKALNEFVQSIDETMKYSVSAQGLKWRFEALKTGRSFAEVVMYHTLLYRVEQAFLFHKKTGLLLQHVAVPTAASKDADMISGLLTAINDFARESFTTTHEQNLMKLDYGDLEVWIEGGTPPVELAYLAVVINGNAPEGLRTEVLLPALEAIHGKQRDALLAFEGDTSPFALSRPHLEDCLQAQYRGKSPVTEQPKGFRLPPTVAVPLALLLVLLCVWGFFNWRAQRRWNAYLAQLQAEQGVVVTEQGHLSSGLFGARYFIEGLRDPLAADPTQFLPAQRIAPDSVQSRWKPYQSLEPALVARRAAVSEQDKLKEEIERTQLRFINGKAQLVPGQTVALQTLTRQLNRLVALAATSGRQPLLEIAGHTDTTGSEALNLGLSQERAEVMARALTAAGLAPTPLRAVGLGTKDPLLPEQSDEDKQLNRRVSFQVTWSN